MSEQVIDGIVIDAIPDSQAAYWVGRAGVTRIEACTKPGMHADIPYVRVWGESLPSFGGECVVAEFCQHQIVGVYFAKPEQHP